jgi:hypothetical protein
LNNKIMREEKDIFWLTTIDKWGRFVL